MKNQNIIKGDFLWLKKHFDKIILVPNGTTVTKSLKREDDKKAFRNVRRRRMQDWTGIDRQTRKRIREAVKANSVELFDLFLKHELQKDIYWNSR